MKKEDIGKYSFIELSKYFSSKGNEDLAGIGATAESMREYIIRELRESTLLSGTYYSQGYLEIILDTIDENLTFNISSMVTKAKGEGNCVRFPRVEMVLKTPSFEIVETPKQGEKFIVTQDTDSCHYDKREIIFEEKKMTINAFMKQLKTEGGELNKEYKDLLKSHIVEEVYKSLFIANKEVEKILPSDLLKKFNIDIYDEEVMGYMLENYITLENFEL